MDGVPTSTRRGTSKQDILKMAKNMLTNQKEAKRAIKAAVDQAKKVKSLRTHCVICNCTPKPDEWSAQVENCCFDCA